MWGDQEYRGAYPRHMDRDELERALAAVAHHTRPSRRRLARIAVWAPLLLAVLFTLVVIL